MNHGFYFINKSYFSLWVFMYGLLFNSIRFWFTSQTMNPSTSRIFFFFFFFVSNKNFIQTLKKSHPSIHDIYS